MGWMTFLVDKKNGVKLEIGKSSEDNFLSNLGMFKDAIKKLLEIEEEDEEIYDVRYKKYKDFTVGDLQKLLKCAEIVLDFNSVHDNPLPYFYYLRIAKNPSENYLDENFEIVNDTADDFKKYRKYKTLKDHATIEWEVEYDKEQKKNKKTKRKRHR